MSAPAAVAAHHVVATIAGRPIVDGVTLSVPAGEWLCVAGPNGAGKTTLLRVLAGLLPSGGRVEIAGHPLGRLRARERARLVAMVPQAPVVPPGMRVLDYVLLGRTAHLPLLATERAADLVAAQQALAALDLPGFTTRTVDSLSGGERQRVVLARALAQDAPILLLDEPTTALDVGHQQDVLELVDTLRRARDLTVVSTMHDLTLAGQYADRLVLLRDGRIVEDGPPASVITGANLARHYGAHVTVVDTPDGRVIVPRRRGLPPSPKEAP
jgi:iron complex transport system ATP-binding protein